MSKLERAPRSAYDRALDLLEARARGTEELRRLLIRKGEPAEEVDRAIERLVANGLLNDANFARQFARSKVLGAGLSRRRLQQELTKRGVARELSADAIEQVFEDESVDDAMTIQRVAQKKLRTLSRLDPVVQRRRLYAFLARRGYDADDIQRVLRTLIDGSSDPSLE